MADLRRLVLTLLVLVGAAMGAANPALAHKNHNQAAAAAQSGTAPVHAMSAEDHAAMSVTAAPGQVAAEAAVPDAPPPGPANFQGRLVDWLGRWHPSVVHFPIALFIVTGFLEAASVALRRPSLAEGARVSLALAALGAVVAVVLGWLNLGFDLAADDGVERMHRWLGTAIALVGVLAWWSKERLERRPTRALGLAYGLALGATVIAVAVNGYLGGAIVHGADHMAF